MLNSKFLHFALQKQSGALSHLYSLLENTVKDIFKYIYVNVLFYIYILDMYIILSNFFRNYFIGKFD